GHLAQIQLTIQTDRVGSPFKIFRGRQRAMAELTMVPTGATTGPRTECMGYATFSRRLHGDEEFGSWFALLDRDIDRVADGEENTRLVRLQRDLVDMIDFLDSEAVRIPRAHRKRMAETEAVAAMPSALAELEMPLQRART